MLSKAKIKLIQALQRKKERYKHRFFLAEGDKIVVELLQKPEWIVFVTATAEWIANQSTKLSDKIELLECEESVLKSLSSQATPAGVLAVVRMPEYSVSASDLQNRFSLVLDNVQDPGNMGTIIRTADWFGIEHIICSVGCVDCYNPKVVQSAMGSLMRVKITYTNLTDFLPQVSAFQLPVYVMHLEGINLYTSALPEHALVIMGNESQGVSPEVADLANRKLYIPEFPEGSRTAESLNVAIAASIVCAEFRRPKFIC